LFEVFQFFLTCLIELNITKKITIQTSFNNILKCISSQRKLQKYDLTSKRTIQDDGAQSDIFDSIRHQVVKVVHSHLSDVRTRICEVIVSQFVMVRRGTGGVVCDLLVEDHKPKLYII
jgi:hypothetical protein